MVILELSKNAAPSNTGCSINNGHLGIFWGIPSIVDKLILGIPSIVDKLIFIGKRVKAYFQGANSSPW